MPVDQLTQEQLNRAFKQAGWKGIDCKPPEGIRLDGLFEGGFATCAVLLMREASDIEQNWAALQGFLAELKKTPHHTGPKDWYLMFVIERLDERSLLGVQRVLDDTRVCRKMCLELRGRNLSETLKDVPFFTTPGTGTSGQRGGGVLPDDRAEAIPDQARKDLEFRSARVVFERLKEGRYGNS